YRSHCAVRGFKSLHLRTLVCNHNGCRLFMFKNLYRGLTNAHCNSPIKIISINNEIINGSIKKNQQPSPILVESSTLRLNGSLFLFLGPFPSFFFRRPVHLSILYIGSSLFCLFDIIRSPLYVYLS